MNNSLRIKQITNAAVIVALYAIFFMISRFTGSTLEYEFFYLVPVPLAIYAFKYDWKVALIPLVSTTLVSIFACMNPLNAFVYVLPALIIGLLQGGILSKKNMKMVYIVLICTMVSLVTEILSSIVLSSFLGIDNVFVEMQLFMEKVGDLALKLNISDTFVKLLSALIEGVVPSFILMIALMEALFSYLFFYVIVLRMKILKIEERPSLIRNKIPFWVGFIYIVIVIAAAYFVSTYLSYEGAMKYVAIVVINLYVIFSMIYMYLGVQVSAMFIRVINRKWLILIVYLLLFVMPLVGLIDNLFDLKQKILDFYYKKQQEQK